MSDLDLSSPESERDSEKSSSHRRKQGLKRSKKRSSARSDGEESIEGDGVDSATIGSDEDQQRDVDSADEEDHRDERRGKSITLSSRSKYSSKLSKRGKKRVKAVDSFLGEFEVLLFLMIFSSRIHCNVFDFMICLIISFLNSSTFRCIRF